MKRIFALLLTVVMMVGMYPATAVHVLATEAEELPVVETIPEETTQEETTEPVTEATDPVEETTAPTTEATEPATEATEPVTEATEPVTEVTEPVTEETEPVTEATEEPDNSCGENVTWMLADGVLTISGTGPMADYTSASALPWYDHHASIIKVVIEEGVTGIADYAFSSCSSLWHVLYKGTEAQWNEVSVGDFNEAFTQAKIHCDAVGDEVTVSDVLTCKGKALWHCSICNEYIYDTEYTGQLGEHTYENGACSVCGEPEAPLSEDFDVGNFVTITDCAGTGMLVKIPATIDGKPVTTIGEDAYKNCDDLKVLILPASVTNIKKNAFYNCGLWHVLFEGTEAQWEAIKMEEGNQALLDTIVHCEATDGELIPGTQVSCTELPLLECTVCGDILYDETYEGSHDFVDGFCTICKQGEEYSYSVKDGKVTITDYLGTKTEVTIPSKILGMPVVAIGNDAFADCTEIKKITIPNSIISLGEYAFAYCRKLTDITIPASVKSIGAAAFTCCDNLVSAVIPNGITRIETDTFFNCPKLASVTVPDSITYIGEYAFGSCYALKSIYIPEGVTHIGDYAFRFCKALTVIDLPASLKNIGECTFSGCHKLKRIEIPAGIKEISYEAFHQCWDMVSVTIPASVKTIQKRAFAECDKLKCVVYSGTADQKTKISIGSSNTNLKNATWHIGGACCTPAISKITTAASGKPNISWSQVYCASSYEIYRCTTSGGKYSRIATTVETTFTDKTAVPGTVYYYKLKAVSGAGVTSKLSDYKSISCRCGQPDIKAEVKPSSGQPVVFWQKVEGAKKYEVYRAASEKGQYSKVKTTTALSYTDTETSVGKSYYYKVKAIAASSSANSGYSQIKSCLCVCAQPAFKVSTNSTTGKPTLSWSKVTGASKYAVYRAYTQDGPYELLSTQTALNYTDSAALADADCWYKVNAIASAASRNSKDAAPKRIHSTCAKPAIKAAADPATGYPVISWAAVNGAKTHTISRSTKSSGTYTTVGTVSGVSFTDTTAVSGKRYYYKVTAVCQSGAKSAASSYKSAYCDCAKPDITVKPKASTGKPVVSWKKIPGAKKYEVYRATSEKGKYSKVKTTSSLSYTDTKASFNKTYYYKVKALASSSSANSVYSDIKFCLTVCAQPVAKVKLDAASGKPVVSWKAVSGAVSYEVYRSENGGQFVKIPVAKVTTYTDKAAVADRQYTYKVKAVGKSAALNSVESNAVSIYAACAAPKITGSLNGKKPMVSWSAVDGATGYTVYRSTKKSSGYKAIAKGVTETSYTDASAKKGKTYYYKVVAQSQSTTSAYSNYVKRKSK